jgi:hypothetical protein
MTTEDKLELIEVYRRITELEQKVFKWKYRWRWLRLNIELWVPACVAAAVLVYMGFLIGAMWHSKPY